MGQFNYFSTNITTWIDAWSKVIDRKNIVIAAPCPIPERCTYDVRQYPIITPSHYAFYLFDYGNVSPYANMIRVIREIENLDGILYFHDDLLLHFYLFEKIGGREWIVSNLETKSACFYDNSS